MEEKPTIYTIGHSTHQLDYFLELLREYEVNWLVDVRSNPASSHNPQFNQEPLSNFLKKNRITYLHYAEEFGARQTDPAVLDNEGKVDFEKVRKTRQFKNGLEEIWNGINKGFVIAIMCSESEPLDCHRFSMVSVGLKNDGFEVKHILRDKMLKTNEELENDLLKKYEKKLPQKDLFNPDISNEEQLMVAYRLKNNEIGFVPNINNQKEEYYD